MSPENAPVTLDIPGLPTGLRLYTHDDSDRIISETLRRTHIWEPYETKLTVDLLQPGDVFVDVGANIGYYTVIAAQRVGPHGKVYAYEPDPRNFALLEKNIALNGLHNVALFPCALYDDNRNGKLYVSGDNYGDHRIYDSADDRTHHDITLVHGGNHLGQHTQRINFLKVDTQGSEFYVINGLRSLLEQNRQHLSMVLEFSPWGIRRSGADAHALVDMLEQLGLTLYIIDHIDARLIPAEPYHLHDWVKELASEPDNEGFINLLLTPRPVSG